MAHLRSAVQTNPDEALALLDALDRAHPGGSDPGAEERAALVDEVDREEEVAVAEDLVRGSLGHDPVVLGDDDAAVGQDLERGQVVGGGAALEPRFDPSGWIRVRRVHVAKLGIAERAAVPPKVPEAGDTASEVVAAFTVWATPVLVLARKLPSPP